MESREFAAYGYQIDNTMNKLVVAAIAPVFIAIPCAAAVSPWFLLLLLVPVGIFIHIKRSGLSNPLLIAGRYLILGERILYYRNISRATLDKEKHILTLTVERGAPLVISADKFPTNARKPDKIKVNKRAKFEKVADKILSRLKEVAPDCVST